MMLQKLFFTLVLSCSLGLVYSANLQGRVTDKANGERLVGCTLYIEELEKGTVTGFDGSFVLRNIPYGNYRIKCSFISYQSVERTVHVDNNNTPYLTIELEQQVTDLNEVLIMGHQDLSSEKSARASERNADKIINVMSAKAIELSPDLNVANVIQRMSGVTMERNSSGEAQYAILRGMDKRYNYTLVNGVKIPSPDNKHRFVPLDIFPSELLDRVEVTKSLTADMEADATGGVINLIMKDAPARFMLQANGALGYNSRFLDNDLVSFPKNQVIQQSPREVNGKDYKASMTDFANPWGTLHSEQPLPNGTVGLAIGNRFLNKRLGVVATANYQNFNKGNSSTFYEEEMIQTERSVRLTSRKQREYSENQIQYGAHAKVDFRLSNRHKLEWYNAFIGSDQTQVRQSTSISFKLNYDPTNGNEDLAYQTRLRTQKQQLWASNLNGNHRLTETLSMQWSAVLSKASNRLPEQSHINLDNLKQNFVDNIYVDADGSTRRWESNSDRDYAFYLNLKRETDWNNHKLVVKAGGLFRDKKRINDYVNYRFKPANGDQRYGLHFTTLDEIEWTLYTPQGSVGPLVYDAKEQIAAGYANTSLSNERWFASLGIRAEYTNQGYFMHFPNAGESPDGEQIYTDFLPSVQLKYTPNKQVNWKASYFRSINRPGFFEIVPYQITNEEYNEFGNKDLKRATIDNADLRWEYFPRQQEQLMVGVFYKNIQDPIEYAYFTTNYRQYGYGPVNLGNAQNFGLEIDFIKFIRNIGVKANYTFTHSVITTPKAYYGTDENGSYKRLFADQTPPLVGQAEHVGNLSLLYKNTQRGWDAQLAAAYTGEKIDIASHYLDSDYWTAPSFQMDASAEKKWGNGISVFIKINNLLYTPRREYIKTENAYNNKFVSNTLNKPYTLIKDDRFGRTLLLGIRYKIL